MHVCITHLRDAPSVLTILSSASKIHTSINFKCWQDYPTSHPNQELVQFFLNVLIQGFRISFSNSINSLRPARKNLQDTTFHLEVLNKYLKDELALNRVYGAYPKVHALQCRLADLVLFPKATNQIRGT